MPLEGFITSAGQVGPDFHRSDGRAYLIIDERVIDPNSLLVKIREFSSTANSAGRRRWAARFRATQEVIREVLQHLPVEARIPLSLVDPNTTDEILMLGKNVHTSTIPEWGEVYAFWQDEKGNSSPTQRVEKVWREGFGLTDEVTEADAQALTEIWGPFGWTEEGVLELIRRLPYDPNRWFSGVVERSSNRVVAACIGERLSFGGVDWCEGTEYGTARNFRGNGLGTAAVVNLQAQMVESTRSRSREIPLIVAELNTAPRVRADILARHTGMIVPYVQGVPGLESSPTQILKRNVSIIDDDDPNDLDPTELGEAYPHYREAFGENYSFWRNFIVGVLPDNTIRSSYRPQDIANIRRYMVARNRS